MAVRTLLTYIFMEPGVNRLGAADRSQMNPPHISLGEKQQESSAEENNYPHAYTISEGGNTPFHDLPLRDFQQFTLSTSNDASASSSNELARPHPQLAPSHPSPATHRASTSRRPKKLTVGTKAVAGDGARPGGSEPIPTSRRRTPEEKRARKIRMKEFKEKLDTDKGLEIEQQSLLTEAKEKLYSGQSLKKEKI
ncbi:MAG: hypothetical protein Q9201_003420 [Fulgogasparrea decipioides]